MGKVHCEVQVQVLVIYESRCAGENACKMCMLVKNIVKMLVYFIVHGLSANFDKKRIYFNIASFICISKCKCY
jgi:hypothetical protein